MPGQLTLETKLKKLHVFFFVNLRDFVAWWLIIFLGLVSCQENRPVTIKVEKYNHNELMDTLKFEMIKVIDETKISIAFKKQVTDTVTVYNFEIATDDKSEIRFMGIKSPLVDRKQFEVDGSQVEILKYRYDEEDGMDEELDFYLTADGDILGFKELAWNGYEIFVTEQNRKVLAQLTNDTTSFFKYNYRFKYM